MLTTLCADCGHIYPSSRGTCPYCLVITAESEMSEYGVSGGELEYTNALGVATVSLPPDLARIRRTATWMLLCSASIASYMLIQVSAGPPNSLLLDASAMNPTGTKHVHEHHPFTVVDRESSEIESTQGPTLVR